MVGSRLIMYGEARGLLMQSKTICRVPRGAVPVGVGVTWVLGVAFVVDDGLEPVQTRLTHVLKAH